MSWWCGRLDTTQKRGTELSVAISHYGGLVALSLTTDSGFPIYTNNTRSCVILKYPAKENLSNLDHFSATRAFQLLCIRFFSLKAIEAVPRHGTRKPSLNQLRRLVDHLGLDDGLLRDQDRRPVCHHQRETAAAAAATSPPRLPTEGARRPGRPGQPAYQASGC